MDFDKEEISEDEIDALGIKKKDNDDTDDSEEEDSDAVSDDSEEEKESVDEGIFGDDKELEEYMLSGYEENY
ncbi:MAG: hypothetical protein KBC11_02730 [Candidatus Pacebacteria bacterium]|nr:hypothetical protein [Candidatus Paceibacterota bacterium]